MIKLTGYGIREWLGSAVAAIIIILLLFLILKAGWTGFTVITVVLIISWIAIAAFFRDPDRDIPDEENVLVAPADGKIKDIRIFNESEYKEVFGDKSVTRIGLFLSIFNVHINRMPCDLEVTGTEYKEGKFHDARNEKAITENESNAVIGKGRVGDHEFPVIVKQISGAVARRIVCGVEKGETYKKGKKFGMIKFGSRTEIYLPSEEWMKLKVRVGDKVLAGETVIANIKEQS
ncbi:MAG: phosphatidylserine decarboxylase [Victivallales bacterium]|nr:phosphatidylserine decarboxylase [Victivallales bacterium]MCF7888711.1 phosphatidylserine decarboxylase [Victivallales bacterium]